MTPPYESTAIVTPLAEVSVKRSTARPSAMVPNGSRRTPTDEAVRPGLVDRVVMLVLQWRASGGRLADRGGEHALRRPLADRPRGRQASATHHGEPIAQSEQLRQIRADDENGPTGRGLTRDD